MKKHFLAAIGDGPMMEKVRVYLLMDDTDQELEFVPWDMPRERELKGDLSKQIVGTCHGYVVEYGASENRGAVRLSLETADDNPLGAKDDFRSRDMRKDSKASLDGGKVLFGIPVVLDNRHKKTSWRFQLAWSRYNG